MGLNDGGSCGGPRLCPEEAVGGDMSPSSAGHHAAGPDGGNTAYADFKLT